MTQENTLSQIRDPKTYRVNLHACFGDLFKKLEKSDTDETVFKAVQRETESEPRINTTSTTEERSS